ncbi:MAG: RDD family protein [Acidimicrobiales bacterium]|jgi:uncharacterized RDD family membrane protein YckC
MGLEDRYVTATPESVSLSIVLAGLGSRFAAFSLDFTIQVAALVAFLLTLSAFFVRGDETSSLVASGAVALFALLDFIGYFVVCEMLMSGRSIGKRAAGLRVVRADGGPVGFWASSLRNVLRLIDMLPIPFYLVGSVLILATSRNQRLGDLAGGTLVIRDRTAAGSVSAGRSWNDTGQWMAPVGGGSGWVPMSVAGPGALPHELAHWDVSGVPPADVMVAGMFLSNRYGYTLDARARLGTDLANRIWPGVAGAPLTLSPEQFLEAVVLVKSVRG